MSRSGGQSEARPLVPKKAWYSHLSTLCSRNERLSRPYPACYRWTEVSQSLHFINASLLQGRLPVNFDQGS
ncbi:hypothetical protein TNCV_4193231 [Trichonephila clavipes]|nr:hypothetical protein TNCV_4193231 [Trichonephila clavipes]